MNRRSAILSATLALAGSLAGTGAQARDNLYWSIGIQAPLQAGVTLGTVFSNAPAYRVAPVVYAEPVVQPAPVWVSPAPVMYAPAPRYVAPPVYAPQRVVYEPHRWHSPRGHGRHGHWHHDEHEHHADGRGAWHRGH